MIDYPGHPRNGAFASMALLLEDGPGGACLNTMTLHV